MFAELDVEFRFAKIQNFHLWGGGSWNLMFSSDLLKSKIPICGGGVFAEFDVEFRFAKIQNSHLWGRGFTEFDVEFRFAKSKIPICRGEGVHRI